MQKPDDFLISFSDIYNLLKKNRKTILISCLIGAALTSLFLITRPLRYEAIGTFREKTIRPGAAEKSIVSIFGKQDDGKINETISTMTSHALLSNVTKKLHMQGHIQEVGESQGLAGKIADNVKTHYAKFKGKESAPLWEPTCRVDAKDITYDGEMTTHLVIQFTDDNAYNVFADNNKIGEGTLDEPFTTDYYAFTLIPLGCGKLDGRSFTLSLLPLASVTKQLQSNFTIEPDDDDPSVLKIKFQHPSRTHSCCIVDTLMDEYQNFLQNESDRYSDLQMTYLQKKHKDLASQQESIMNKHADLLSKDLSQSGFFSFDKEIGFLFQNRLKAEEKIQEIDLNISQLKSLLKDNEESFTLLYMNENLAPISGVMQQLAELNLQKDSLSLALASADESSYETPNKKKLNQQIADLEQIDTCSKGIQKLIVQLQNNQPLKPDSKLIQKENLLIGEWFDKLETSRKQLQNAEGQEKEARQRDFDNQRKTFIAYLSNLQRLYEMHGRIVQERLSHSCQGRSEFQGLDLETASKLYLEYLKLSNDTEAKINEYTFILQELKNPNFEISCLSSSLNDPIAQETVKKASSLYLLLRDEERYSAKEKERTRSEIDTQKRFLKAHLEQTADILKLERRLINEKTAALQGVMLELTHEKTSLLEKHIKDYVQSKINNLSMQRELTEKVLTDTTRQMATLPEKWISEQLMLQSLSLNKTILEELTRLSENKSISHNLDLIQSAPLDKAYSPLLPKAPNIFFLSLTGALTAIFLSSGYFIGRALVKGVPATENNLRLTGHAVAGSLSKKCSDPQTKPLLDSDLDTLRREVALMEEFTPEEKGNILVLLLGKNVDYSLALATLLSKKSKKVLLLPLTFDQTSDRPGGLLGFLQGTSSQLEIVKEGLIERINAGGVSRWGRELIGSEVFQKLLNDLKPNYDWIIAVNKASVTSAEAESYLSLGNVVTVTINDENLNELAIYLQQPKGKVTFIFEG